MRFREAEDAETRERAVTGFLHPAAAILLLLMIGRIKQVRLKDE